ncbi:MAG: alpha/beta fold hydrolase [Minwuia sp.]|uniref:alpha/beta fold hydrolase n=1 Tax=Minwuia sp. TaxID=2493630 RepID=UPI003A872283
MDDWTVEGEGGKPLGGLRWDAAEPKALLYIAHGLAEHVERYDRFANALNGIGVSVAGHDHRGHKRSVGNDADTGHFADRDGFRLMARDLARGVSAWRATSPALPLILFGHSMGSFLTQMLLDDGAEGIDMAILSGSNGAPPPLAAVGRAVARIEKLRLGGRGRSKLIHGLAFDACNKPFEPAPTKLEWLSRERAEVDAYIADPWCGFIATTASWAAFLDFLATLGSASRVAQVPRELPVLIASGERDPVGGMGKGVQRLHDTYRDHGVSDLTIRLYPDARHEILNETNRDEVTGDLLGWIGERIAG